MAISPFIRDLRAKVGNELLVLPSVSVLPIDDDGRLLLVQARETGLWQTVGGAVEPDESPREAAVREAKEEAGVDVRLGRILDVIGGPPFRIVYPNGDQVAYVTTVFEGVVVNGVPRPDGDETSDVAWWSPDQLEALAISDFTRLLLDSVPVPSRPPVAC